MLLVQLPAISIAVSPGCPRIRFLAAIPQGRIEPPTPGFSDRPAAARKYAEVLCVGV